MSGGTKNAHLALIFSGREFAQADVEAEWYDAQPATRFWPHLDRGGVERLLLIPI